MEPCRTSIAQQLLALQEPAYRAFQCRLMPTVDPETVLGIRTPILRDLARKLRKTPEAAAFLQQLPHTYYDENNLHAFLLEQISDFDAVVLALDAFLPYVDNWATCDSMKPKCFGKNRGRLRPEIRRWMASQHPYTVRFGIEMLMNFFLDDAFDPKDLAEVASVKSEMYYVRMMQAWYFATALAKHYDTVYAFLAAGLEDTWVFQKTIQKALESYRITQEQKASLRMLKKSFSDKSAH